MKYFLFVFSFSDTLRRMSLRSLSFLCGFLLLFLGVTKSEASPFHSHEHGTMIASSSDSLPICKMKLHEDGLPCPHKQGRDKKIICLIAPHCAKGHTTGVPSSVDYLKNLFLGKLEFVMIADKTEKVTQNVSLYEPFSSSDLDPPPKLSV